jgi:hypothetical protein
MSQSDSNGDYMDCLAMPATIRQAMFLPTLGCPGPFYRICPKVRVLKHRNPGPRASNERTHRYHLFESVVVDNLNLKFASVMVFPPRMVKNAVRQPSCLEFRL